MYADQLEDVLSHSAGKRVAGFIAEVIQVTILVLIFCVKCSCHIIVISVKRPFSNYVSIPAKNSLNRGLVRGNTASV